MAAEDPIKAQFDILRKRARQAATTATQQEREGLTRRFASIGQVGSGAQIRAEAQAAERGAKRLEQAEETVGLAELAERQRQKEIGEARAFARGEREASQLFGSEQAGIQRRFAAEQAGLGRTFASGEREASQRFGAEQAGLGREFARGERVGSQEFARGERVGSQGFAARQALDLRAFQAQQAGIDRLFQERAFNEGIRQFDQEFARDTETIEFNKRMAEMGANQTLLDDLGLGSLASVTKAISPFSHASRMLGFGGGGGFF